MSVTPTLTNFTITPRTYSTETFDLIDPSSNNTNSGATFSFTSSNTSVAEILNTRTVIIRGVGVTNIIAKQEATFGFTTAEITAVLTVTKATTVINTFTIDSIEWNNISFQLTDPTSNNPASFFFESLTPTIVTIIDNRTVRLHQIGRAQIRAIQNETANYTAASTVATFDVLSSIVRVGNQNRIDLSWNTPMENGATIKNYFFYTEERNYVSTTTPKQAAPSVTTVIETVSPINSSYYSYSLPSPYTTQIMSASGNLPTGIDVNSTLQTFDITTTPTYTNSNFFDLGYYGEIEVSWEYHNDKPIAVLDPSKVASTTMTLSLYKATSQTGENRVDLLLNASRFYDSSTNCLGPMPQNNNKTITEIFPITFQDIVTNRELKYMKHNELIFGRVALSNNTYFSSDTPTTPSIYSIIIKSIRIAPFRFPISRDFTSLSLGRGISTTGVGFSVSTLNALSVTDTSGGILYHMPKMTRPLTKYSNASWTFTWNYAANISKLATDISQLPLGGASLSSGLNIPFNLRIRGYSRSYTKPSLFISDISYNTTSIPIFLKNVSDVSFNTKLLFDVSLNDSANYAKIAATTASPDASFGIVSRTFDISGSSGFPEFTETLDHSHTQFVFLFQLTITDPSYNAYFKMMNSQENSFQVKMLSQTFTPHQVYRFAGPDPTLESSNALTSSTNTTYNIGDYYTPIKPFYSFFDLTDGAFYSYRIASHNIIGTCPFSRLMTRRCGSLPNPIVNRVNSLNSNTFTIESERTSNRVNIYWEKPSFTGYDIQYFVIQTTIDMSGLWLNSIEYTPDISSNLITFNLFDEIRVYITDQDKTEYDRQITTYTYNSLQSQQYFNTTMSLNTPITGNLINGYKYYFRLASVNELGRSEYSSVLSGIPFARPSNAPTYLLKKQHVKGNNLVILTWQIPEDDGGSPILSYVIDYQEVLSENPLQYGNKIRYIQNEIENQMYNEENKLYPFDDFRKIYSGYRNFSSLTTSEKNTLFASRQKLLQFVIPPRPITITNTDVALGVDLSNNIILKHDKQSFTYKSAVLNQNVFDMSNIQLKWYYVQDNTNGFPIWTNGISSSFHLSIKAHLQHDSTDRSRDISGIFDISGTYNVNTSNLSNPNVGDYRYINYIDAGIITDIVPHVYTPTLPRIDVNNGQGYFLILQCDMSNISRSDYRFHVNAGKMIINGTAPVRTNPSIKTEFTFKLENNLYSQLVNNKKYLFTVTPFNINDFFPDPSGNNSVMLDVGTSFSSPITDVSYSLVSTNMGGKVTLTWKYATTSDYYIGIKIPEEYSLDYTNTDQEYPPILQFSGNSILASKLEPASGTSIVSYTIPSDLPRDILSSNAQKYLKSGRGYHITVSPVELIYVNNENVQQVAPSRNMYPDETYIIPFRQPNRPHSLSAYGNNTYVTLKWRLPDINTDPNYYTTYITTTTYYRYNYFSLERRDISSADPLLREWRTVTNEIVIPEGSVAGYEGQYTVSGLTNELNMQFRVQTVIVNEYNGQRAYSDYTYMQLINNIPFIETSGNTIYPSLYPYKPSPPFLRFADRTNMNNGINSGLTVLFNYPTYNGNATYYECEIYYTQIGGAIIWRDIFDANNGIADLTTNINLNGALFTTNRRLRTTNASITGNQTFTVLCKSTVLNYGIRIRLYPRNGEATDANGFYPYGSNLYSDYSNISYINI
jgi:hypothetical protein